MFRVAEEASTGRTKAHYVEAVGGGMNLSRLEGTCMLLT